MALVDFIAEDSAQALKPCEVDLNDYQRRLLEELRQDLRHRPKLRLLRRRGYYTFYITDDTEVITLRSYRRHCRRSRVTFDSDLLTDEALDFKLILQIACDHGDARLVDVGSIGGSHTGIAYKVWY